jgi:MFS family permease
MTAVTDINAIRSRRLVLAICSTGLLMVGLDATIVNIALPAIHRSLGSSLAGLQWTVDAYTLVLASLLMLAGSTADRIGRKRVFQLGLLVFSVGSLLCALAPTLDVLIAARVLQAIGGSMLSPVAMSIIRNVFVDPAERARAIGVYAAMFGLSIALGPVLGGALVGAVGWRAVFLVNLPLGALAILATGRVARSRDPTAAGLRPASWRRSPWRRWPSQRSSPTSCGGTSRSSTCAGSAARRSPAPARWPSAPSRRSERSSS